MSLTAMFVNRLGPTAASYRYRAAIPAQQLGMPVNGGEYQVIIFSKPMPDDLILAKECKAEGVGVVMDCGDDHFRHPVIGPVYVEMAKLADRLVTASENMAGRLMKYLNLTADAVIGDPYEEPWSAPHANGATKLLWAGHPANLKEIRPWLKELEARDLTIVTGPHHGDLGREWVPWSTQAQTTALQQANVVLIPTRPSVEFKSANRLVNALRAGCFPICGPHIPAYKAFRQVAWVGHCHTGLKWAEHCQDELNDRVAEGQHLIEKFSPETISKQWLQLIESFA